jgi:hypothetical protein
MNKLDMNLFAFVAWLEQNRHAHSEDRLTINDGYEWYNYMWNIWLKNSDAGRGMMMECYFIPSSNTSSTTICGNCGKEKMLHTIGSGIKVSKSITITKEEILEKAAEYYAHNNFEMHETNHYKALKQGFEAGAKWQANNGDTTAMGGDNIPDNTDENITTDKNTNHPRWTSTTTWDKLDMNNVTRGKINMSALRETITKYLDDIDSFGDDKQLRESIDVLHDFVLYIDATDENGEVNVAKWGDFIIQ